MNPLPYAIAGLGTLLVLSPACCPAKKLAYPSTVSPKRNVWQTSIDSRAWWNDTRIPVQKGETYRFHADGEWKDWFVTCGPRGAKPAWVRAYQWPTRWGLRFSTSHDPDAAYFQPIGAVAQNGTEIGHSAFIIRNGIPWEAPASGTLVTFANDLPFAYGNNSGSLSLTVTKEQRCPPR